MMEKTRQQIAVNQNRRLMRWPMGSQESPILVVVSVNHPGRSYNMGWFITKDDQSPWSQGALQGATFLEL